MASRVAFMLRAFSYPNYRLFFGGQIVSLIGSWMSMTATSWLVYRLTGSAMALGVVGFAGQFPGFVMGPFAGAFLDRWDRHRVLVVTQTLSMVQSFALALLTFTGHITVPRDHRVERRSRHRECFRYARTAGVSADDDFRPGGSGERHCDELVDVQRGAADRAVGRRVHDCDSGRGVVFSRRRRQLLRRHHRAPRDEGRAAAASPCCARRRHGASVRGLALRARVSAHSLAHAAAGVAVPGRDAVLRADAGVRRRDSRRRAAHARAPDGSVGPRSHVRRACG